MAQIKVTHNIENTQIALDAAEIPNLDASKITTGDIAAARLNNATVDLQPIKSDISALALREATNESSAAFNLPNQFIDTFATDTLGTKTIVGVQDGHVASIYSSQVAFTNDSDTGLLLHFDNNATDSSSNNISFTTTGSSGYSTSIKKFGTHSKTFDGSSDRLASASTSIAHRGTSNWTIECWYYLTAWRNGDTLIRIDNNSSSAQSVLFGYAQASSNGWQNYLSQDGNSWFLSGQPTFTGGSLNTWQHLALERHGNNFNFYLDGVKKDTDTNSSYPSDQNYFRIGGDSHGYIQGYMDEVRYSTVARYEGSNFTPNLQTVTSATGTAIQNTNTVGSAKTKVGGTMLYKDNAGTATLGTDLKIYFTCNGGTNWTEATSYSAITPVYSTGIKQIRLGETTCTSGTDIRYKAVWANQAASSKETQLHGIGINY